jgi:C-methyltransferase
MTTNELSLAGPWSGAPIIGPPPVQAVLQLGWGMWTSGLIRATAELHLADALDDRPATVNEMAEAVGADTDALGRLLRALAACGIFRKVDGHRYAHTVASRALRSDAPERLLDILLIGSDWGWTLWGKLADAVRTGTCAFRAEYGMDLWTYFAEQDPQAGARLHRGYSAQAEAMTPALVDALDCSGLRTIADIAGGQGSLLRALLERYPNAHGVLFEVGSVLSDAEPALRDGPLATRCRLVAGDCVEEVPVSCDLYVFRQILHMWDDKTCMRALRNCALSAQPGARVVLFEQLVGDPPDTPFDALMDLHMLLVTGGRDRTEQEYARLFEDAGLCYVGVTPTSTPLRLIEAVLPARVDGLPSGIPR